MYVNLDSCFACHQGTAAFECQGCGERFCSECYDMTLLICEACNVKASKRARQVLNEN